MSIRSFLVRLTTRAVAVAAFGWTGSAAVAADVTPPLAPAVLGSAPVTIGAEPGCPTCQHGTAKSSCPKCSKSLILGNHANRTKGVYPVTLCPGACFGYFQTQWRKWDEVCPYPYLGTGVSDAPRPPAGVLNPKMPGGGELSPPRPVDPKAMPDPKKVGSYDLPPIPNKFGP